MSADVDLSEFLPPYLAEVEELLATARKGLLAAEAAAKTGSANPFAVRELFRAVHTIKGLSAMIDVEPIVSITHEMESCLRAADRAGGTLAATAVEPLLEGLRAVEQRVSALATKQKVAAPSQSLLERLRELENPPVPVPAPAPPVAVKLDPSVDARLSPSERTQLQGAAAKGLRVVRLVFTPSPANASAGLTINTVRDRLRPLGELIKVAPQHVARTESAPAGLVFFILLATGQSDAVLTQACPCEVATIAHAAEVPPAVTAAARAAPVDSLDTDEVAPGSVVRVPAERLDDALERLSAMFVGRSRLNRAMTNLRERGVDVRELSQLLGEHSRQLRDLRAAFLRLRMVPVSQVLAGLPLVLRGLRRTTGKEVSLELEVGKSEVDKAVGDRLIPAIVHLARNAVDHAVEPASVRAKAGKPPVATIRVACHDRSSTQLELSVTDDGAGIDAVAVAAQAGVPVPETDAGLLELLCRPGLSTRASADTTSGRGMGMDIVRGIVEGLGGELQLSTRAGVGTTFTLRVPLTITIVDALVFEAAGSRYAVPLGGVEELIEVDSRKFVTGPSPRAGHSALGLMVRRGNAMPVVSLARALGVAAADVGTRALVVRQGEESIAFAVDRMVGQQEIVVRPLDDVLVQVAGVSGAADLGDGTPTLVLDLLALGAVALSQSAKEQS